MHTVDIDVTFFVHVKWSIDVSQVRHHIKFYIDQNEAVRYRPTVFTVAHTIGPTSCIYIFFFFANSLQYFQNCLSTKSFLFFFGKTFWQLNNCLNNYNPLNSLKLYPSQPYFHSSQKCNMALP